MGEAAMILGVVLAGGQSSRFGSDKALAELHGRTLIARAVDNLSGWCDHVVIVGRATGPAPCLPDWPRPGMGPLAGLAAALTYAQDESYRTVLSCAVDSHSLPANLLELLSPAPAYLEAQPVIGHWLASSADTARNILLGEGSHSMMAFADAAGARSVKTAAKPANINTPADLAAMEQDNGI
ncbi:molybdenum cofactor guanylyltransferase [Croceibacterium xixiisoli]